MNETDSDTNSSNNGIDQKAKKLKADPDMHYKSHDDEPYHEQKMLATELEALYIERREITAEENELRERFDALKKRKKEIDTQIAVKRLKQAETSKTRRRGSK